ncbi:MAG TPA: hypothetical protein VGD80_07275 [Kofleriaceae bacterium]
MKVPTIPALIALRTSAVLTLVGLGLMVWSMLQPTPLPVMLAMTVGQGIGCMAFGLYLYVVIRDLRHAREPSPEPRDRA